MTRTEFENKLTEISGIRKALQVKAIALAETFQWLVRKGDIR